MASSFLESNPEFFPFFFVVMWLFVTTILGLISGWYGLMRQFPDREDVEWMRLGSLSGSVGLVHMRGILSVAVCPSGLRVRLFRVFGPFCRPFFVPWEQIEVERERSLFWGELAKLRFGSRLNASLKLPAQVADKLARSSNGNWPEGVSPFVDKAEVRRTVLAQWVLTTALASTFFIVVPRLAAPESASFPPIAVAILFPAIVLGIAAILRYRRLINYGR